MLVGLGPGVAVKQMPHNREVQGSIPVIGLCYMDVVVNFVRSSQPHGRNIKTSTTQTSTIKTSTFKLQFYQNFDFPNFDFSKFDFSNFDFPNFDFSNFDSIKTSTF